MRPVSTRDALRDDLRDLEGKLDYRLKESQARYNCVYDPKEKMEFVQSERTFIINFSMK